MKKSVSYFAAFFFVATLVFVQTAQALDFARLENCPTAVKRAYGGIAIRPLPDGRLLIWDGDALYVQKLLSGDGYDRIASGYIGDTGFMAIAPDGHTVLLGAGFSGKLYRFDARMPADYTPVADLGVVPYHYWGAFLTDTLVVIDKKTDDYTADELAIIDVTKPDLGRKRVMLKPAVSEIPVGGSAWSTALAVDGERTYLYAMALVYDEWYALVGNQLKRLPVSALINAYNLDTLLDWDADADAHAIGLPTAFLSGGPVEVMASGDLLVVGNGGIQQVRPTTAAIIDTYAPAGDVYYGVAYNPSTGDILPIATDTTGLTLDLVYAPEGRFQPLPVLDGVALTGLIAALAIAAKRRLYP